MADKSQEQSSAAQSGLDELKASLPTGLADSIVLLQQAEAMPTRTAKEEKERAAVLAIIRPHVFAIQQGDVAPPIDANRQAATAELDAAFLKQSKREMLARGEVEVRAMLNELAALQKEVGTLRSQVSGDVAAELENLQTENEALRQQLTESDNARRILQDDLNAAQALTEELSSKSQSLTEELSAKK